MGKEIGIDLGTTNTVVTYQNKKGRLRQLKYGGDSVIPSVLYFYSKDEYVIGQRAKKLMMSQKNKAGIENFKSFFCDASFKYEVIAENGERFFLRAREAAKYFLNKIIAGDEAAGIAGIEDKLIKEFGPVEGCIDRAVITVPAKFSTTEKEITRKAAHASGLQNVKLAAEPTAAAIAHMQDMLDEAAQTILVYDFGGGTFDISIIHREQGPFEEIATNGDKKLGGNNLTKRLAQAILERINDDYGLDLSLDEDDFDEEYSGMSFVDYYKNIMAIRQAANNIKESLSEELDTEEPINLILPGNKFDTYIADFSRDELEELIRDDIEETVDITDRTIQEAHDQGIEAIDQIVLAGGSSNIPLVREMLEEKLKEQNISNSDDVSTLISRGAAILAQNLQDMEEQTQQLTNVQMGTAAVEGVNYGKFQVIIPENTPLPCTARRQFDLLQDGQRRLTVPYYEYDIKNYPQALRVDDKGIEEIDKVIIDLPPSLNKEDTKVEVEFTAQADGSMDIKADVMLRDGRQVGGGSLKVYKESDLE